MSGDVRLLRVQGPPTTAKTTTCARPYRSLLTHCRLPCSPVAAATACPAVCRHEGRLRPVGRHQALQVRGGEAQHPLDQQGGWACGWVGVWFGRAGGLAGGWTSRSLVRLTGAAVCVPGCACIAMCVGGLMGLACRMPPPGALPLMPACERRCLCPAGDLLRPPQEGINAVLAHQPPPLRQEAWLSLPSIPAAAIQQHLGLSPLFSATPAARPQHCTALGNIAPPVVLPRFRRPLFGRVHRPSAARGGES